MNHHAAHFTVGIAAFIFALSANADTTQPRLSPEERQKINDEFLARHKANIAGRESKAFHQLRQLPSWLDSTAGNAAVTGGGMPSARSAYGA